ncbi:MAG: HlyD family type I secretion periplasmic adaptor subunit [Alphaproteobacteria bacterium]
MLQIISYGVIAVVIWAAVTDIREVAPARGELIHTGKIQLVQHFEGGIVDDLLVKPGDEVRKGDVLVRLKERQVSNDVEQLRSRLAWLSLEEIRLAAEQTGAKPDFSSYERKYPNFVAHQKRTYAANIQDKEKNNVAYDEQIKALRSQVGALVDELEKSQKELITHKELFEMQEALLETESASKRTYLEFKSAYQRVETARAAIEVSLAEARKDLSEIVGKKNTTNSKLKKNISEQRAKIIEQRLELSHQLDKYADRFERLLVRSPTDGIVKELTPKGPGFVVQPGQLIAEVVPKKQKLVAEVKIRPRDVGHVKVGDEAEMEITTYDSTVYGKIMGQVSLISAASFKDDKGAPYFRAEITLASKPENKRFITLPLVSGMVVEANILTGSKSILRYLLKPIYKSLDRAFSER